MFRSNKKEVEREREKELTNMQDLRITFNKVNKKQEKDNIEE